LKINGLNQSVIWILDLVFARLYTYGIVFVLPLLYMGDIPLVSF